METDKMMCASVLGCNRTLNVQHIHKHKIEKVFCISYSLIFTSTVLGGAVCHMIAKASNGSSIVYGYRDNRWEKQTRQVFF